MWKWLRWVLLSFIGLCLLATLAIMLLSQAIMSPMNRSGKPVTFFVRPGDTAVVIARSLEARKIIKSAMYFRIAVRVAKVENKIKAGEYRLGPDLSPVQILDKFVRGEVVTHKVTIPEGYNNRQIAELLDRNFITAKEDFLASLTGRTFTIAPAVPESLPSLDGCLFPDTYYFPLSTPADKVIDTLTNRFREVVLPVIARKPTTPLKFRQALILASLIEMEAQAPGEYPIISGVYHNRLRIGMRLECDATIQFLLPSPKQFLLFSDLKTDSPYNTYLYSGLPPGPICNPGLKSIEAALFPQKVDYLFYVARGDGTHIFSRTYGDHLQAVEQYRERMEHQP